MKKLYVGILLVSLMLIFIGCSDREQYILEGESDHWEARLKVTVGGEGTSRDFVVNYKGGLGQLADVNHLEYAYRAATSSGRSETNFNEDPPRKKTFSHHGGSNGSSFDGNQTVDVTIKWDEHEEKLELKR
ncbi:hypothetical protein [Halobacillus karajensis]|uniref:Lipoprotein n=1 Tax=Halobacillus karajensis TaxID=195088 RepID=A0A024P9B9_9BACI|nr:hypothetical protein [Halobacillus karajensis]CDQ20041.1 hypothetical protein BN982_02353 [Halobacillus karajensis]CDQ25296.1 hypothetical protein BN983_03612 [Halobacillus karajensis]CDQ28343.1 hypothetical protein BN981_02640 [Halobacillus karajensis]